VKVPGAGAVPPIAGGEVRYVAKSRAVGARALPLGCHTKANVCPVIVGLAKNVDTPDPVWYGTDPTAPEARLIALVAAIVPLPVAPREQPVPHDIVGVCAKPVGPMAARISARMGINLRMGVSISLG
jgi:hypothetical protein